MWSVSATLVYPTYADHTLIVDKQNQELRGILAKYEQASQFLQGIGINPPNQDLASAAENYVPASNATSTAPDGSALITSAEYPENFARRQTDGATSPDYSDPDTDGASTSDPDATTQDATEPSSPGDVTEAGGVSELNDGDDGEPPVTGPFLPSVSAQPGTARQPLKDDVSGTLDLLYYGPINIGTPAQVCGPMLRVVPRLPC